MNQQSKTTKKEKNKVQIRDLKVKKDPKGGRIGDPCEGGEIHLKMK
jgi:hypothetical protein